MERCISKSAESKSCFEIEKGQKSNNDAQNTGQHCTVFCAVLNRSLENALSLPAEEIIKWGCFFRLAEVYIHFPEMIFF